MNVKENTVDTFELFKKRYGFSTEVPNNKIEVVLQSEAEKENECILDISEFVMDNSNICNNVTSSNNPIWIMVNKKQQDNKTVKSVGTDKLQSANLAITNTVSYLSNKCDSITDNKLLKLNLLKDAPVHDNIFNTRNLPNILRGPKTLCKSIASPIPFETEDNFLSINSILENNISEEENNRKIKKKSHRKRKQVHSPLIMQEESTNLEINTKLNYHDQPMKKNNFDLKKAEKLTKSHQTETCCKKKQSLLIEKRNQLSSSPIPAQETVQDLGITAGSTLTCTDNQTKDQMSDLNLSSEFNAFYEEQFHEDYMDHFDILTETLKECQALNDSYDHECYDINSNNIVNSNSMKYSKLHYEESPDYNFREQKEYTWDDTNVVGNNNSSEFKDYFHHNNSNSLTSPEYLESMHAFLSDYNLDEASIHNLCNKNYMSSYLNNSFDDEFCLNNLSHNCLQNSFHKDEAKHLNTLLVEDKKWESNLENHLNNDLNSSMINSTLTNATKNPIPISLNNGLEHSTTIQQHEREQENVQFDVLKTDSSANMSSDHAVYTELNNIYLPEENHFNIEETEVHCNYIIEFNCEKKDDKHPFQVESDASTVVIENLNKINETMDVIKPLQCLLCALTFTSKRTLALHLSGAHGDMYLILCERCGRLFNKKCIFNRHFIHCGCVKLPFTCKQCNKTYRHKSSLLHHLKVVHQIETKQDTTKVYKCDICSKVYRKYGAFEKHLGMHIHS